MRHRLAGKHLNRTTAHRMALRRNLAASLFEHGTISTTRQKAKFVQPFAEKLITLAKDGSLHARRRAIALLQDRDVCKVEGGEPVKETKIIAKLFSEIGPRFLERNGGYTRIINLPLRRVGDNGLLVLLQLVGEKEATVSTKPARRHAPPTTPEPVDSTAEPVDAAPDDVPVPKEQPPQEPSDAPVDQKSAPSPDGDQPSVPDDVDPDEAPEKTT